MRVRNASPMSMCFPEILRLIFALTFPVQIPDVGSLYPWPVHTSIVAALKPDLGPDFPIDHKPSPDGAMVEVCSAPSHGGGLLVASPWIVNRALTPLRGAAGTIVRRSPGRAFPG